MIPNRHIPRVCHHCGAPLGGNEDACWRCGTPYAASAAALPPAPFRAPHPDGPLIRA